MKFNSFGDIKRILIPQNHYLKETTTHQVFFIVCMGMMQLFTLLGKHKVEGDSLWGILTEKYDDCKYFRLVKELRIHDYEVKLRAMCKDKIHFQALMNDLMKDE